MLCNVSLQIIPNVPEVELYPLVDQVISLIKDSGVNYVVGPMETTMEGELLILLGLVQQALDLCVKEGANRVLAVVKVDYKVGGVTINEKIHKYK
ncbi:MAG: MTH1187 family thiamine-binding protein [Chitinophagales bacterium]